MKYPEFLKDHGTIVMVAPSFGCTTEPYKTLFESARRKLKKMGYNLRIGPNCTADDGIGISSSPYRCGRELESAYRSDKGDAIMSVGGGELMCEDLDYIDLEKIEEARPKWFMGYSDNTNFTFLLSTICDTAAIYGPCATSFGAEPYHNSLYDAIDLLRGEKLTLTGYGMYETESLRTEENPLAPYNPTQKSELHLYRGNAGIKYSDKSARKTRHVTMRGRLIGGCMDCLRGLIGTPYDNVKSFSEHYKDEGILWFLESCDLNVMDIRRTLWQMESAGWFENASGFIIGRPLNGDEMMGMDRYEAVTGILGQYGVPIVMDADLGHVPPMVPVISGCYACISASPDNWKIDMELI